MILSSSTTRDKVADCARGWIDTPWHHMQRKKGLGVDCVGLLICVARELGVVEPDFDIPAYPRRPLGNTMLDICNQYMRRTSYEQMQAGDVIVIRTEIDPQHVGILGNYRHGGFSIIHAAQAAHPPRVIETRLMFARGMRFVMAYVFPGVE